MRQENKVEGRLPVVLVTGASTGIGLALAKELLSRPYHVVLTARSESLQRFERAGIRERPTVWLRPLDVTSDRQRRAVVSEIDEKLAGVDVLVNNAGVAYRSVVEHVFERERLMQMDINFRAPMGLTRLVLPAMRRRRSGRVINVSSVGGMMAMPTMAVYSASKFALEGATEALWYEVRPWGIFVTLVEPGFVRSSAVMKTRFTKLSEEAAKRVDDPYHNHYMSMGGFIERLALRARATPESIARRLVRLIESRRPPLRAQVTWDAHFFTLLRRLLPRRVYHAVLYRALPGVRSWGHASNSGGEE